MRCFEARVPIEIEDLNLENFKVLAEVLVQKSFSAEVEPGDHRVILAKPHNAGSLCIQDFLSAELQGSIPAESNPPDGPSTGSVEQ